MSEEQKMSSWRTRNIAPQEHILSKGTRNNASGEQLSSHSRNKKLASVEQLSSIQETKIELLGNKILSTRGTKVLCPKNKKCLLGNKKYYTP
jgi:hypothetical protein